MNGVALCFSLYFNNEREIKVYDISIECQQKSTICKVFKELP